MYYIFHFCFVVFLGTGANSFRRYLRDGSINLAGARSGNSFLRGLIGFAFYAWDPKLGKCHKLPDEGEGGSYDELGDDFVR